MQKGKAIPHRHTDLRAKLNRSSCLAANHRPNLGFKISLQVVELVAYCGFYLAAAWFLLFGDIEETALALPRS